MKNQYIKTASSILGMVNSMLVCVNMAYKSDRRAE